MFSKVKFNTQSVINQSRRTIAPVIVRLSSSKSKFETLEEAELHYKQLYQTKWSKWKTVFDQQHDLEMRVLKEMLCDWSMDVSKEDREKEHENVFTKESLEKKDVFSSEQKGNILFVQMKRRAPKVLELKGVDVALQKRRAERRKERKEILKKNHQESVDKVWDTKKILVQQIEIIEEDKEEGDVEDEEDIEKMKEEEDNMLNEFKNITVDISYQPQPKVESERVKIKKQKPTKVKNVININRSIKVELPVKSKVYTNRQKRVCFNFSKWGKCKWGVNCKFEHKGRNKHGYRM